MKAIMFPLSFIEAFKAWREGQKHLMFFWMTPAYQFRGYLEYQMRYKNKRLRVYLLD